ncbi:TraR/DksA family transcriptional regulator [Telluria aromaticivorans]|uniref:TraR/DksA family transcriptional regulator n=1 Tax=Telluria aromaticivorans TaxID=2725995 RepID=A0A7Y2NYY3_9BURK|nr:TraR/DksA family transcriptional regulator [Telluria aromaticivorans]NNG21956.1 TraR/DksA family transcriptional regulator [Telluria aromaticivorans]
MPPLSHSVTEELSKRLHQARDDLLETLRSRTGSADDDAPAIGALAHQGQSDDGAQSEMLSHNEQHLADHESALLHEIGVAIGKLESGGAGICETCGCDIPEARLMATPTVRLCIACQEQLEKDQHTGRGPSM